MTWKLYESMCEARAEAAAEACEDTPADPIDFYIKMQKEWQKRWDFTPEDSSDLEEWNRYLDSIEGGAHA